MRPRPKPQRAYKNLLMKQDDDVLSDEASNRASPTPFSA